MLRFFKRLFSGKGQDLEVEPVDFKDGLLRLRTKGDLPLKEQTVMISTPEGMIETLIHVRSYDQENGLYLAEVPESTRSEDLDRIGLRVDETTRISRVLSVSGRELPDFAGFTEDISVGGMRLSTSELLEPGKTYELTLQLDNAGRTSLKLQARVTWSANKANGTCHSGLRFHDIDVHAFRALARFIQARIQS